MTTHPINLSSSTINNGPQLQRRKHTVDDSRGSNSPQRWSTRSSDVSGFTSMAINNIPLDFTRALENQETGHPGPHCVKRRCRSRLAQNLGSTLRAVHLRCATFIFNRSAPERSGPQRPPSTIPRLSPGGSLPFSRVHSSIVNFRALRVVRFAHYTGFQTRTVRFQAHLAYGTNLGEFIACPMILGGAVFTSGSH